MTQLLEGKNAIIYGGGGHLGRGVARTFAHEGATVFLAPASECKDAAAVAPKSLTVVKVDTLKTAVAALKAIAAGSTSFPHC